MHEDDTKIETSLARYPNFKVISRLGVTEYRYYRRLPGDPAHLALWLDAIIVSVISYLYYKFKQDTKSLLPIGGFLLLYVYVRCTTIIYESLLVLPPHGVQLEIHRGPFGPLSVSRRFISSEYISDVIINEALRRWNVRYYLAIIVEAPGEPCELAVAFETTLPQFPVLLQVYRGTNAALFRE